MPRAPDTRRRHHHPQPPTPTAERGSIKPKIGRTHRRTRPPTRGQRRVATRCQRNRASSNDPPTWAFTIDQVTEGNIDLFTDICYGTLGTEPPDVVKAGFAAWFANRLIELGYDEAPVSTLTA